MGLNTLLGVSAPSKWVSIHPKRVSTPPKNGGVETIFGSVETQIQVLRPIWGGAETERKVLKPKLGVLRRILWSVETEKKVLRPILWVSDPNKGLSTPAAYRKCRSTSRFFTRNDGIQTQMYKNSTTPRRPHNTRHETQPHNNRFGALVQSHPGDWITPVGPGRTSTVHGCPSRWGGWGWPETTTTTKKTTAHSNKK